MQVPDHWNLGGNAIIDSMSIVIVGFGLLIHGKVITW